MYKLMKTLQLPWRTPLPKSWIRRFDSIVLWPPAEIYVTPLAPKLQIPETPLPPLCHSSSHVSLPCKKIMLQWLQFPPMCITNNYNVKINFIHVQYQHVISLIVTQVSWTNIQLLLSHGDEKWSNMLATETNLSITAACSINLIN